MRDSLLLKRNKALIPFLCLIVFFFSACQRKGAITPTSSKDIGGFPEELYFLQRSYPDLVPNFKTYHASLLALSERLVDRNQDCEGFELPWQVQGPGNIGGRLNCVVLHPNQANIMMVGLARGGIFKTVDGGTNWYPVFDSQPFLSISDLTYHPTNPQIVYAATGDHNISSHPGIGNGVYKSTDGGETWQYSGLGETFIVSRVVVDAQNPQRVMAATMGIPFERNNDRGLYKSEDGGASWEQVLFISNQTGVVDLIQDPVQTNTWYASGWDRIRNNQESLVTGNGALIFKSTDNGNTWSPLSIGLPDLPQGRVGIAISNDGSHLYALYVGLNSDPQGVYLSQNGGQSFTQVSDDIDMAGMLGGFGWYFGQIRVDPTDNKMIHVLGVEHWVYEPSLGWYELSPPWWEYSVHADKHDLVFDQAFNAWVTTDGGMYKWDRVTGEWSDVENIPNTQFYQVAVSPHDPNFYGGGAQDNGTTGGNSSNFDDWPRIYGGDGFTLAFRPDAPDVIYASFQNGNIVMSFDGGNSFIDATDGINSDDRRNWDTPYLVSPHNPDVLYVGTEKVYKSTAGIVPFFEPISDDLTDGVILNPRYHSITCLDESPLSEGLVYVGTVDANVWRKQGDNWVDLRNGLPERYVTSIIASPNIQNGVFVTYSGYKDNDFTPYIYYSDNQGTSWSSIQGDLPSIAINDVLIPPFGNDSIVFVATDGGIYGTLDKGTHWCRVGNNMPMIPVYDLKWHPSKREIVAGTFARSLWTYEADSLLNVFSFVPPDTTTATTAVPMNKAKTVVQLSPNPATTQLEISFFHSEPGKSYAYVVLDMNGRVMTKFDGPKSASGLKKHTVNISNWPGGQYIVKVKMRHQVYAAPFLKG